MLGVRKTRKENGCDDCGWLGGMGTSVLPVDLLVPVGLGLWLAEGSSTCVQEVPS